jgi:hypothetical protein
MLKRAAACVAFQIERFAFAAEFSLFRAYIGDS